MKNARTGDLLNSLGKVGIKSKTGYVWNSHGQVDHPMKTVLRVPGEPSGVNWRNVQLRVRRPCNLALSKRCAVCLFSFKAKA